MSKLEQINNKQAFSLAWYGSCDNEPCVDFDLGLNGANIKDTSGADAGNRVATIADVTGNNMSWVVFDPTMDTNSVTHLICGHAYFVKLKSGSQSGSIGDIEIPGLTFVDAATTEKYLLSLTCGDGGVDERTPTPSPSITTSPTETPSITTSPTPECPACEECLECPELPGLPTIDFASDPVPTPSVDLGFTFSVDTSNLASACSSNIWKYSITVKGETVPEATVSQIPTSTTTINETVEGGGDYIIKIWGLSADAVTVITDVKERELNMPWPSSNFAIQGDINITYLEHEGPKDDQVTLSDPEGWVASASFKKADNIQNAGKWKYSLDNNIWSELSDLPETDIPTYATLYFRLKVGHLGGDDDADLTTQNKSYDSEVTIVYVERNGDTKTKPLQLTGTVLNRIIGLHSWVDKNDTDFKATLTISRWQLARWQYQLEKLNDDEESYDTPKILTQYGPGTIQTDTSEEIDLENYIRASAAENFGPGYYKMSVRGLHNTDDDVVVTPELSQHTFFNWPDVLYTLNGAINNSYREYEGPLAMSTFYFVWHNYFNNWKFEVAIDSDASNWEYQNTGGAITGPLPITPTDASSGGIGFRMIEGKKASATPKEFGENTDLAYSTDIKFYIYGKNAIPTLAEPADPVEVTKTIKTTVIERYLTNNNQTITPHPDQNLITIKVDFSVEEMNRWQPLWLKGTTSLASPGVQTATGYSSNTSDEYIMDLNDVSSDYLTANNTFYFKVIGYSTTDTGTTHESGWVANQVAPTLEYSFTIAWPTTIFEVSDTISNTYVWQGVEATPANNGSPVSITKGWVTKLELKNSTGLDSDAWEYSVDNGSTWTNLEGLITLFAMATEITDHTKLKLRLVADLAVGTYNDATIDVVATDIQGIEHTETINLQGSVTKPPSIFTPTPTTIAGEYRETEGPSAEKTITISTQFLSSVKWKSSGEIYWEYLDGTWKPLPADYVTILNKPFQANQTHSAQQSLTIKVRLKAGLEVPDADDMDSNYQSHNFNNVITFEALSSHGDDVTAGKQVALNGTVTEYPNGCADYALSFATTGGEVDYGTVGISLNKFQSGGHICVNNFGNSFGTKGVTLEVRDSSNNVITTGSVSTNWDWANGTNIVYKAPDQMAYEAKNFAFGAGNVILTPMNL